MTDTESNQHRRINKLRWAKFEYYRSRRCGTSYIQAFASAFREYFQPLPF